MPDADAPDVSPSSPNASRPSGWRDRLGSLDLDDALLYGGYLGLVVGLVVVGNLSLEIFLDPFGAIFAVVPLVFLALHAWRGQAWSALTAGIVLALPSIVVLLLFGGILLLTNPLTGVEFAATSVLSLVLVMALTGGILGFRRRRREAHAPPLRDALRTRAGLVTSLLGALVVGMMLSGILAGAALSAGGLGPSHDFATDRTVEVTLKDFAFNPQTVAFPAGELVEVVVTNDDPALHTFTYENDGVTYNHIVPAHATVTFLVFFTEEKVIDLWCEPHKSDMTGHIHAN